MAQELIASICNVDARTVELCFAWGKYGKDESVIGKSSQNEIEARSLDVEFSEGELVGLRLWIDEFARASLACCNREIPETLAPESV